MRKGHWIAVLSAAVFCGAISLGGVAVPAATGNNISAAGPNIPEGDWIVGPINAASSSGVGFCSMKNNFHSGQTLVFARDAEGSNSLAVDFRRKLMQAGGQYTVVLTIGTLRREMSAIAATSDVMIIQMGLDHDFYTALQRKGTLQIDFQTSQLSFALKGANEGLAALTACAQAVSARKAYPESRISVKGAAPQEAVASAATQPAASAAPQPAAVAKIEPAAGSAGLPASAAAAADSLPADNVILPPAQLGDTLPLGARKEVIVLKQPKPEEVDLGSQAVTASLRDEAEALRAENHRLLLENEAVATRMQGEEDQQLAALETENRKLKARLTVAKDAQRQEALEAEIQKLKDALAAAEEGQPSPATLTAENQNLKAALAAAQDKLTATKAEQQSDLDAENQKLKAELETAQTNQRAAALDVENKKLKADLVARKAEKEAENTSAPAMQGKNDGTLPAMPAVAPAPVEAAAPTPAPVEAVTARPASPAPLITAQADMFLPDLLARAHVRGKRDRHNPDALTWITNGVHGTAEEHALEGQSVTAAIESYVQEEGAHCKGDFAHRVSSASDVKDASIIEGEIACMDGHHDASAAVLFIARNGKLDVISHEGAPSRMEKSLADRDAVVSALSR